MGAQHSSGMRVFLNASIEHALMVPIKLSSKDSPSILASSDTRVRSIMVEYLPPEQRTGVRFPPRPLP